MWFAASLTHALQHRKSKLATYNTGALEGTSMAAVAQLPHPLPCRVIYNSTPIIEDPAFWSVH